MVLNALVAKKFAMSKTPKSTLVHFKFSSYPTVPSVLFVCLFVNNTKTNKIVFIVLFSMFYVLALCQTCGIFFPDVCLIVRQDPFTVHGVISRVLGALLR